MGARLKKVEINHFKSFADLIIIDNLKSFNVIIGSNGSGKSNFMEAIAFCFGESSSRTRPTNIQNFINSSVKKTDRDCYVACTFELDKNDLTLKRAIKGNRNLFSINDKVYGPGYQMLVDKYSYQEKLRKIGINTKARYFIIYQGEQIELLMETPQQRTVRFEEITGSVEYKEEYDRLKTEMKKKIDQLKNFKDQKTIISNKRRNRIIFEQKQTTLLQLIHDYGKTEKKFFLIQLYIAEEKMKASLERRMLLEQTKGKLIERKRNVKGNLSQKKEGLYLKQQQVDDLENQIIATNREIKILDTKLGNHKNKIENTEQKILNSKKLLEKAQELDKSRKSNIDQLEKDYEETEKLRDETKKQLDQELHKEQSVQEIEIFNALKKEVSSKTSDLRLTLKAFKHEQKELQTDLKKKKKEIIEIKNKINETALWLESHKKCLKQSETLNHELEELKKTETEKKKLYESYQKKEAEIESELKNVQNQLLCVKSSRINFKKSNAKTTTIKRLKEVMNEKIYGYLDELCQPIHARYGIALATVLRECSSIVIVDSQETANLCFQLIKAERLGRIKILPLDVIETRSLQKSLRDTRTYEGVENVKLLIDATKYSEEFKPAVLFALKDTLVCENTEDAIRVAYELKSKKTFNCIALDGTYCRKNGVMSRKRHDIEKNTVSSDTADQSSLKEKYNDLLIHLNDVKEQLKELNLNQISRRLQMKITSMDKMIAIIEQINAQNEERIKHEEIFQSQLAILLNDEQKIENQLEDVEKKIKNIEEQINSIENPMFKKFYKRYNIESISQFENSIVKLTKLRSKKNEYEQHLEVIQETLKNERETDTESNIEKYIKKIKNLQHQLQLEKDEYIELQEDYNKHIKKLESLQKWLDEIRNEIKQLKNEINKLEKLLTEFYCEFSSNFNNFQECSSLYKENFYKFYELLLEAKSKTVKLPFIEGSFNSIIDLHKSDNDDDVSITELDSERNKLKMQLDYTLIEYEINNDNIDSLQLIHDEFKAQLAGIDEEICQNDLTREGSQDLTTLNEDLKAIEKQISQIIAEIRYDKQLFIAIQKKRFDTFMDGFEKVAEAVKKIYKAICGDENAQAFLETLDPTEPYSSDIQYFCVPPGKKFMQCYDLSGGEKTIAMLSLVLAILKANSSFILLLDEIDAPLDKVHFQNIANYLTELKKSHQIIYITLNPKLMEHASGLIGIHPKKFNGSKKSRVFTLDFEYS